MWKNSEIKIIPWNIAPMSWTMFLLLTFPQKIFFLVSKKNELPNILFTNLLLYFTVVVSQWGQITHPNLKIFFIQETIPRSSIIQLLLLHFLTPSLFAVNKRISDIRIHPLPTSFHFRESSSKWRWKKSWYYFPWNAICKLKFYWFRSQLFLQNLTTKNPHFPHNFQPLIAIISIS